MAIIIQYQYKINSRGGEGDICARLEGRHGVSEGGMEVLGRAIWICLGKGREGGVCNIDLLGEE